MSKIKLNQTSKFLTCIDRTVSGEKFDLLYNEEMDMLITSPQPSPLDLPKYYQSKKYISHTDSQNSLTDKIYQKVKSHMLQKKLKWIEKRKKDRGKILDIGAGTGDFLKEAKNRGWQIQGVEPESSARELANKKGVDLKKDLSEFSSQEFDVITMWHVLEHVPNLEKQINQIYHLLNKGGLLIIAVPNFKSYDALYYKENWAAFDVPRHLWHFSQNSFSKLLEPEKFILTAKKGMPFDSYYVSILSEKYKTGKTNLIKSAYIGYVSNRKAKTSTEYSSLAYFFQKTT